MTARAVGTPGHLDEDGRHDLYVEVTGPSGTDVHHNFVQRWNEASEWAVDGGTWGHNGDDELTFPRSASEPRGGSTVQIQRNAHAGRYSDSHPAPGGRPFNIADGERTILEQYMLAIDAANQAVYIENQAIPVAEVASRLEIALKRGVVIVMLVPADPEDHVRAARRDPDQRAVFEPLEALGAHDNFTLVGIAAPDGRGGRRNVYVHGKIMLIDGIWATIGSCNLHRYSLSGHTEMNASFEDAAVVRALRCELFAEHLGESTADLDERNALRRYSAIASDNALRRKAGDPNWQGLAYRLDPAAYGR